MRVYTHTRTHTHICVTSSVSTLSESAVTFEAEIQTTKILLKKYSCTIYSGVTYFIWTLTHLRSYRSTSHMIRTHWTQTGQAAMEPAPTWSQNPDRSQITPRLRSAVVSASMTAQTILNWLLGFKYRVVNKHRRHYSSKNILLGTHKNPGSVCFVSSPSHKLGELTKILTWLQNPNEIHIHVYHRGDAWCLKPIKHAVEKKLWTGLRFPWWRSYELLTQVGKWPGRPCWSHMPDPSLDLGASELSWCWRGAAGLEPWGRPR